MNSNSTAPRFTFDPWLAAIVVLAAAGGALIVGKAQNWAVMPDELIYTELARSITHSGLPVPAFQGVYAPVYQVLFPTLLAPLLAVMNMPSAYPWIAALNACLIASAAIPTYLLANFCTENRVAARWAALCCVITPWLVFASKVLPDALAYATTTWAIYAIARTASGLPRALKGDLLALLAIAVAFLVRNQFLLLLGVWVGAVVLAQAASTLGSEGWRALPRRLIGLLRTRPVPIFTFLIVFALLRLKPTWVLGFYTAVSTTGSGALPNEGIVHELVNHAGVFALGVGALPVILGLPWLVSALGRIREPRQFNTAVVIILASCAVIYVGASFDMRFDPTERVIERYIFYLAPLWIVAMAALLTKPPKNLAAFALPAMVGVGIAIATNPYGLDTALNRLTNTAFSPTQITLIGWQSVAGAIGTSISGLIVVLALLICGFCWWCFARERMRLAMTACFVLLATVLLASTLTNVPRSVRAQNAAPVAVFGARDSAQKRWVELATAGQKYAIAYSRNSIVDRGFAGEMVEQKATWRDAVFWNRGLDAIYVPTGNDAIVSTPLPGASHPILPDWQTGVMPRAEADDSSYLLLAKNDPRFAPWTAGQPLAQADFALYRTGPGQRRAAWMIRGLTWAGWVPTTGATMRIWAPPAAKRPTTYVVSLHLRSPGKHQRVVKRLIRVAGGGKTDFQVARGARPTHIDRVLVSALPGSPGMSR